MPAQPAGLAATRLPQSEQEGSGRCADEIRGECNFIAALISEQQIDPKLIPRFSPSVTPLVFKQIEIAISSSGGVYEVGKELRVLKCEV